MTKTKLLLLLALALCASCTPVDTPPPAVVPQGEDRYLIDPRTGYEAPTLPQIAQKFEAAWRHALAGNEAEARRRLDEILRTNPDYVPATLALASLDIRAGRYADALTAIEASGADTLAARVYRAEIATRERRTRLAYDLYRALAGEEGAPDFARQRFAELEAALFSELFAAAQTAPNDEAIRLLRETLTINAGAVEPRILLGQKLVAQREFDEARRTLDPLLNTGEVDRAEVQEMLAEIDVGRGRFQEAIVRYDRLSRRTKEPRYATRLEEIKEEWSAQNMPSHFRQALESEAVTRADLAVLLYWKVPSIRFAQNLGSPPIAIDISEVAGREEIIRAIAMGLYEVDPVTRRVNPHRAVTAERLSRLLSRVLTIRGATCARGLGADKVLATCAVPDPLATHPADATVPGREVARVLEVLAKKL